MSEVRLPHPVALHRATETLRHPARSLWRYVESHHDDLGVALFVVPVVLVAFLFTETAYAIRWLAN